MRVKAMRNTEKCFSGKGNYSIRQDSTAQRLKFGASTYNTCLALLQFDFPIQQYM